MTMHMIKGVHSLSTRKPKFKMTKAKQAEWQQGWREHNDWLKQQRMPKLSFEEYCDYRLGKIKQPKPAVMKTLAPKDTHFRASETPRIPSLTNVKVGNTGRREPRVYSGERTLLGVAVMHKSNLVPVFSAEEATEIARMRRG